MKLIPILFSTPMVQAILNGNKSMTRRVIKPQPDDSGLHNDTLFPRSIQSDLEGWNGTVNATGESKQFKCPYGQPGDVLWVRENFGFWEDLRLHKAQIFDTSNWFTTEGEKIPYETLKWKPSIHMPFAACRIFLRVKEIRVERLQDISREDCKCEGTTLGMDNGAFSGWNDRFCNIWQSINGADSWNANPWVWVIAFERVTAEKEIAEIRKLWNERRAK